MYKTVLTSLLLLFLTSCVHNKNLAQNTAMQSDEAFIKNINSSKSDTEVINPHLKTLQQQNDLVISFATLNFAWARKATYYVLTSSHQQWKFYKYESKLPPTADDAAVNLSPQELPSEAAKKIQSLYAESALWKTEGDNGESFCSTNKNCNINDAETWTISIATPQNIHTTTYYAPNFFEECCPGNPYRKALVAIAAEIMKLAPDNSSAPEK